MPKALRWSWGGVRAASRASLVVRELLLATYWSESTIIVMIKWTGLAPWEFEFIFPSSLTSTFLVFVMKLSSGVGRARPGPNTGFPGEVETRGFIMSDNPPDKHSQRFRLQSASSETTTSSQLREN